eukprot:13672392-Alexandrium_andersonii.AAC.1
MKILARRGAKAVAAKENVPATRERFTVMTRTAWPALPRDGNDLAILFKVAGEEPGKKLHQQLRVPEGCLL